ncbi:MAG: T9SS type A sorting domain-containing protein [Phycisphaerae bacterium]|nr:T9SS type A sorting domain-containing protein [Saprospiraceae bacterium]
MKLQYIFLLCFFSVLGNQLLAQPNNAQTAANTYLRKKFSQLSRPPIPDTTREYLYDMVAHTVDDDFFHRQCPQPSNTENWFLLYEEMYYAAYDTMPLETVSSVFDRVYMTSDPAIPIGIVDLDYYRFKPNAFSTPLYFDFFPAQDSIADKSGRPSFPYYSDNVFSAAPLVASSSFRDVVFRIDPSFMFRDYINLPYYGSPFQVKVDFGDGVGWRLINPSIISDFPIVYASDGDKLISVGIFDDGSGLVKLSHSNFSVGKDAMTPQPSFVITSVPGLKASVYRNCPVEPSGDSLHKVVIFVEGWDMLDLVPRWNTTSEENYSDMIKDPKIAQLANWGYDFVMVDWGNSRQDLRTNASNLIGLIEYLKCHLKRTGANKHQFVILGHCMGAIVSRYALTQMESTGHQTECDPETGHNCRLFITDDAPNQGANLPMAVQHLYKFGFGLIPGNSVVKKKIAEAFNLFLHGTAAKQLLMHHVDTKTPTNEYSEHQERINFVADLQSMGNYPQHCKLVALSNGSMADLNQTREFDGALRVANDDLLNFNGSIFLRVLGIKLSVFDMAVHMQTNPQGSGNVFNVNLNISKIKLQFGFWFVNVVSVPVISFTKAESMSNFNNPLCVRAGGVIDKNWGKINDVSTNYYLLDIKGMTSGGCYNFRASAGIPWLANGNVTFSLCSDGLHWGFLPVSSALDYTPGPAQMDIESEGSYKYTSTATPYDVIIGIPGSWSLLNVPDLTYKNNRPHRFMRNDASSNLFRSCERLSDNTLNTRFMLNREIGDDQLYLDNLDLNRKGLFESEFDLFVNCNNPFYTYPPAVFGGMMEAAYSKDGDLVTTGPSGLAIFKYDAVNSPSGNGLVACSMPSNYQTINTPMFICCENFSRSPKAQPPSEMGETPKLGLRLFPNPVASGPVTAEVEWLGGSQAEFVVSDMFGRLIGRQTLDVADSRGKLVVELDFSNTLNLPNGIYLISVFDGSRCAAQKLVIQN